MEWYIEMVIQNRTISDTLGERDDVDVGEDDSEDSKLIVAITL